MLGAHFRGYIGMMEKKMETITMGLCRVGVCGLGGLDLLVLRNEMK